MSRRFIILFASVLAFGGTSPAHAQGTDPTSESAIEIVKAADIQWQPLNPARGDQGPKAGTLWGDQTRNGSSGFLVKFIDGFSSPPHIHNVTYRGVVIQGRAHNDDPDAEPMWMPTGSFWTQPAGEPHITSALGETIAFIEIDEGPYLVKPTDEAFDNGERPVNVDASNLVWLDASGTTWVKHSSAADGPEISFLWGEPDSENTGGKKASGSLIKLPPKFSGTIESLGPELKAVVIDGEAKLKATTESEATLFPGSYFRSEGTTTHSISCESDSGCLIYVRSVGKFSFSSNPS